MKATDYLYGHFQVIHCIWMMMLASQKAKRSHYLLPFIEKVNHSTRTVSYQTLMLLRSAIRNCKDKKKMCVLSQLSAQPWLAKTEKKKISASVFSCLFYHTLSLCWFKLQVLILRIQFQCLISFQSLFTTVGSSPPETSLSSAVASLIAELPKNSVFFLMLGSWVPSSL